VAVVNDHPITNFDVEQRIKLLGLLGIQDPNKLSRKAAANSLINDYVKIAEAKQAKLDPSDSEVEDRLRSMAGALKTDRPGLTTKLNGMGLTEDALRQQVLAQMSFARLLQVKYHVKVEVDQAAVDKKFTEVKADIQGRVAKVESDPRRQPITVLQLQEINFPVEGADPQLLQSRAIEAGQVVQKMKSCATIKQATAGIFNVQIGKKIEADSRRLPPPLMAQLKQRGVGKAIGPMRYAKGIQILGYCGTRTITPPPLKYQLPSRQQIETLAINQKYEEVDQKYTSLMRKNAIIEYKDPSYAQ
jgi:peptidyl-prolyl cis-trans isomerase SurA